MSNNKFRDLFCPTPSQEIMRFQQLLDLMYLYQGECVTCKYHIPCDPSLPGFVIDYGSCKKECSIFPSKVCSGNAGID